MSTTTQPHPAGQASDEELLLRYREKGDVAAFETLVHRYERELHNYLYRYLGDASLAEEVFQLTFLRVHEKSHLFEADRSFRPWLYSLATHLAVDNLRKAGRRRAVSLNSEQVDHEGETRQLIGLLADDTPSPLAQLEASERQDWIRRRSRRSPRRCAASCCLPTSRGSSIGKRPMLGIPLGTVKSRLHKALHALNQAWKRGEMAGEESISMYDRLLGYISAASSPRNATKSRLL